MGFIPPTSLQECWAAGWRGDWSCCCRRIPQTAPECLFLFEKILLLNPASQYKEGPVLSHSPPLQLDVGLSGSGPVTAQLSTLPSQHPWSLVSVCLPHFVIIPLPATSSNQVSLTAAQPLFGRGRELLTPLSQESCCRPGGHGPGATVTLVPVLVLAQVPGTFLS